VAGAGLDLVDPVNRPQVKRIGRQPVKRIGRHSQHFSRPNLIGCIPDERSFRLLTGNVALRVPNSKIALSVVQAAGIPITATSANLSGASECTTAEAVRDQLQDRISIIVDGGTSPREVASTIVDLTDSEARWRILREGAIPAQEISQFFAQG
jgi:tRNA A37 threonylcarbamoyladenosine synthetase subunit TsaC/SUA5/YrdC